MPIKDVIKLEVKMKKYNRINKISSSITKEQLNKLMRGEVLPCSSESGSPNAIQMFNYAIATKGLRPKVIVTYNRTPSMDCAESTLATVLIRQLSSRLDYYI